jgi:hypothetical protein
MINETKRSAHEHVDHGYETRRYVETGKNDVMSFTDVTDNNGNDVENDAVNDTNCLLPITDPMYGLIDVNMHVNSHFSHVYDYRRELRSEQP